MDYFNIKTYDACQVSVGEHGEHNVCEYCYFKLHIKLILVVLVTLNSTQNCIVNCDAIQILDTTTFLLQSKSNFCDAIQIQSSMMQCK